MVLMAEKWSEWQSLNIENIRNLPTSPGCYKISCSKPINRLFGTDDEGILNIGESKDLNQRLDQFIKAVTIPDHMDIVKGDNHSAGGKFSLLRLQEEFPVESLRFKFAITESKEEAERLEAKELERYEDSYLEFPPLNTQGPKNKYYRI